MERDRIDEFLANPRFAGLKTARIAFERIWREGARVELARLLSRIEASPLQIPELAESVSRIVQFAHGGPQPLNSDLAAVVAARVVSSAQADLFVRLVDGRTRVLVNDIRITKLWLAERCGIRQPRTAGDWIDSLKAYALIDVIDHDPNRGTYTIRIHDPTPEPSREQSSSPQKPLPFPEEIEESPPGDGAGVGARQSPPATSAARQPPREDASSPSQSFQGYPDVRVESAERQMLDRGSGVAARQPPRAPMITNELRINSPMPQRNTQREPSLDPLGALGRVATVAPPPDPDDFMRMPALMADKLNEATEKFLATGDPGVQREKLRQRINIAVGNHPERDWWVSGKTADLVAHDHVEARRIDGFIETVIRRRRLPKDDKNCIEKPEAWFQRVVQKLCNERGIPFNKKAEEACVE